MKLSIISIPLTFVVTLAVIGHFTQAFDPSDVSGSEKRQWCKQQVASCENLCVDAGEAVEANTCRISSLHWTCTCTNGVKPNVSEYRQTIPYFICRTNLDNCIKNCESSADCANGCNERYVCSTPDPHTKDKTDEETDAKERKIVVS